MLSLPRFVLRRSLLGLLAFLPGLAVPDAAGAAVQSRAPAGATGDSLRAIVRATLEDHDVLGLSVAAATDGRLVFSEGFGAIDLERDHPATGDTRYRIASVTKPVTAVAVLQLAAAGRLDLEDAVFEHCPTYPDKPSDPTVRHLLAHQGGIRHTTDGEDTTIRGAPGSLAEAIAPIADEDLRFEPGERMLYTSWGYAVLGCVIETVSGQSYRDYVRERVLEPAGMEATIFDRPDLAAEDFSPGYRYRNGSFEPAEVVDTRFKLPASGLVSTAPDLVRFALALGGNTLLPDGWRPELFEVQHLSDGSATNHTLGWLRMLDPDGTPLYFYGGSMEGTTALLAMVPDSGRAVAVLGNRERYTRQLFPMLLALLAVIGDS